MVLVKEVHSAAYPGDGFLEEEQTIEELIAPPRKSLDASALQHLLAGAHRLARSYRLLE